MSENGSGGLGGRWWRPMVARRPDEHDRVSTPLELFFNLCFVVAVSQAAAGLYHAVSENHVAEGVLSYLLVFFAIWWAWMNFTWFASEAVAPQSLRFRRLHFSFSQQHSAPGQFS